MLVLTRKPKEQIQIGDNITVTIMRVKGQAIRVGIEAPANVRVLRSELMDRTTKLPAAPPGVDSAEPTVEKQGASATKASGCASDVEEIETSNRHVFAGSIDPESIQQRRCGSSRRAKRNSLLPA